MFKNRQEAGRLLAEKLLVTLREDGLSPQAIAKNCVVVGLPRGGVPVALEVALALHAPLDVLVSKKICAPDNPELAIGAVSSSGVVVLDDRIACRYGEPDFYEQSQKQQAEELTAKTKAREAYFVQEGRIKPRAELAGKWIILVDDGIATGMTVVAALHTLMAKKAEKLILATPVIPYDTYSYLIKHCDRLVALSIPVEFLAVGRFYRDFHQVEDKEVIEALRKASQVTY